jgi:hypothetical protein
LEKDDASGALESLAQRERLYPYELGLGAVESSLLEKEKRLGEAVFAAFTDLAYAWSLGLCGEGDLEAGLRQAEAACAGKEGETEARLAVRALRAYRSGARAECLQALGSLGQKDDSFAAYARAVSSQDLGALRLMENRYSGFPEYWLNRARLDPDATMARAAAERVISLAPHGPLQAAARSLVLDTLGLKGYRPELLLCPFEVDSCVRQSLGAGDPGLIDPCLATLELPDNPYSLYALGALKALSSDYAYQRRFTLRSAEEKKSPRLKERLAFLLADSRSGGQP